MWSKRHTCYKCGHEVSTAGQETKRVKVVYGQELVEWRYYGGKCCPGWDLEVKRCGPGLDGVWCRRGVVDNEILYERIGD